MTATLETIKAKQAELNSMIKELQRDICPIYVIPEATLDMKPGERYAGLILDDGGDPSYHLVLLPGEAEGVTWKDAKAFAKSAGGELPTRREQSLLFANLKGQFKEAYYWSGEQHAADSDFAWCQSFNYGYQDDDDTDNELRARAVRRSVI